MCIIALWQANDACSSFVQVFRQESLVEELLIEMDLTWTGNQKFQLQVWAAWLLSTLDSQDQLATAATVVGTPALSALQHFE